MAIAEGMPLWWITDVLQLHLENPVRSLARCIFFSPSIGRRLARCSLYEIGFSKRFDVAYFPATEKRKRDLLINNVLQMFLLIATAFPFSRYFSIWNKIIFNEFLFSKLFFGIQ